MERRTEKQAVKLLILFFGLTIIIINSLNQGLLNSSDSTYKEKSLKDAWNSYNFACIPDKPIDILVDGSYSPASDKITNNIQPLAEQARKQGLSREQVRQWELLSGSVQVHEECHRQQFREKRYAFTCFNMPLRVSNEFECYEEQYGWLMANAK